MHNPRLIPDTSREFRPFTHVFVHLLVSFGVLLVNSNHLLVSFGVLLVNSNHLLVSFCVLLVNSNHLLVNSTFPTTQKKKHHYGTSF
ncbi:hypothetical protein [Peribacillus frigoritolerans]|uniref:hypothetical protein n=1 Tax=Peribacillus frigoritolerans TaxID=450367 RepID=UPI0032E454B5